jgi:hypothetical protein
MARRFKLDFGVELTRDSRPHMINTIPMDALIPEED